MFGINSGFLVSALLTCASLCQLDGVKSKLVSSPTTDDQITEKKGSHYSYKILTGTKQSAK